MSIVRQLTGTAFLVAVFWGQAIKGSLPTVRRASPRTVVALPQTFEDGDVPTPQHVHAA